MHNNQLTLDNSTPTRQLPEELPGSWYNYEASEITLDAQEFDHWLCRLEDARHESPTRAA
jgi:hypothetical protein